jgi:fimbrial isopeptide formation D2 family protein/LPXTG-motif cell wall-anchored protein
LKGEKNMKKLLGKTGALLLALLLVISVMSTAAFAATSLPDTTSERILEIYKYSPTNATGTAGTGVADPNASTNRIPLQNVQFDIYKVPANQTTSATPTDAEKTAIMVDANLVATITTDASGHATHSFGTGTANDGIYLVVERDNAAVSVKAAPFYLNMPLTNTTGDGWLYDVIVYPKNDVKNGPGVDKDVSAPGTDSATADIGKTVQWIIKGEVPSDLFQTAKDGTEVYAKKYSLTDTIDSRLNYKGNVVVKLLDKNGTETVLPAADYDAATGTTATVDAAGGTLKVTLTNAGMKAIQQTLDAQTATGIPEIRVYFDTAINSTAVSGTTIPNNVTIDYTNSTGKVYDPSTVPEDKIPEVHTGGLMIDKVKKDSPTTKLDGATFKIARDATAAEIADASVTKETITVGGVSKTVVFVNFYNNAANTGSQVADVTTANGGQAVINGLAYGTYYLVETKAPSGYNMLTTPVTVTIDANSLQTANAVQVADSQQFTLPITGGSGTLLFTLGGVVLIGTACILIFCTRRKKNSSR